MKRAFSLAEVMVTLAVVGVIAALTMPTLIQNHKDSVLKAQFKAAYNLISHAYGQAVSDLGYSPKCFYWTDANKRSDKCVEYGDDNECIQWIDLNTGLPIANDHDGLRENCPALGEALRNNLKMAKICKGNAYANGCIPKYEGNDSMLKAQNEDATDEEITQRTTGCRGYRQQAILTQSWAYVLTNGMIVITYAGWHDQPVIFGIDINGKKGPNKWGYDVFNFQVMGDTDKEIYVEPSGGCGMIEKGGRNSVEMFNWAFGKD